MEKLTAPDLSCSTLSYSTDSTECLGEQKLVCRKFWTKLCLDNLDFVTLFWYCDHSYSSAIRPIKIFLCISHVWCRRWTYEFKIPNHLDQNSLLESLNLGLENVDMGPTQKIIIRLWRCVFMYFPSGFFTWKGSFLAADLFVEFITRWAFQPWALFKWLWIDRGNTDSTTYRVCKSFSLLNAVPKPAGCLKASGQLFTYTQQAGCVLSIHPIFWCIRVENHSSIG